MRVRRRGSARGGRPRLPPPGAPAGRDGGGGGGRRSGRRRARRPAPGRAPAAPCSAPPAPTRRSARSSSTRPAWSPGPAPPGRRAARTPRSVALAQAGGRARGGTAVVTLEPCRHTGRTGPCTAGPAARRRGPGGRRPAPTRPAAAGGGADELRAAGVDVVTGLLARRGRRRPARGLAHRAAHRPAVRHLEVRRHARRALGRRRRHQPLDHRRRGPRGRAPAARRVPTPSSSGSARCWPTTPS